MKHPVQNIVQIKVEAGVHKARIYHSKAER